MKKLRGIRLTILGIILYLPNFIWSYLSENVPSWMFWISFVICGGCILIGLLQIFLHKDDALDDDLKRQMQEKRTNEGK